MQHVGRRTREGLISGCSVRFVRTGITVSVRILSDSTNNTLKNEKTEHWHCAACNKGVVNVLKILKLRQLRQDKMDEDLGKIKGERAEIKGETTQMTIYGDEDW